MFGIFNGASNAFFLEQLSLMGTRNFVLHRGNGDKGMKQLAGGGVGVFHDGENFQCGAQAITAHDVFLIAKDNVS